MQYDFDNMVQRDDSSNLKSLTTPEAVKRRGLMNFSAAEMDFMTAPSIIKSMGECVKNGLFGFTLVDSKYRNAVRWWMATERGFSIEPNWVIPSHGTIFSVATAIRLLTNPNDGVIISPPVYHRYEQAARRLGRNIVRNELVNEGGYYSINFDDLERKMSDPANKLYVLCNPQNPIGRIWRSEELERIAYLANKYDVFVFSDEIFAEVIFDGRRTPSYIEIAGASKHGIVATSLGKAFNFTGVNHANIIIEDSILRSRFIRQRDADHYGSIDPLAYAAILGAYTTDGREWLNAMRDYTFGNARIVIEFMRKHAPTVVISPLEGCFCLWLDWSAMFKTEAEMMNFLIERAFINPEAGSVYGSPVFSRINLTTPRRIINLALENLERALGELK